MILYNQSAAVTDLETDNHFLPTSHIQFADGTALLAFVAANTNVQATLTGRRSRSRARATSWPPSAHAAVPARRSASASRTSPRPACRSWPATRRSSRGPGPGPQGELFQAIAGTSMSSPHVAGAARAAQGPAPRLDARPDQVRADDDGADAGRRQGGRRDARRSLRRRLGSRRPGEGGRPGAHLRRDRRGLRGLPDQPLARELPEPVRAVDAGKGEGAAHRPKRPRPAQLVAPRRRGAPRLPDPRSRARLRAGRRRKGVRHRDRREPGAARGGAPRHDRARVVRRADALTSRSRSSARRRRSRSTRRATRRPSSGARRPSARSP